MILNRRRRAEELGDIEWWDQLRVINILVGSVPRQHIAHYSIHGCADVLITGMERIGRHNPAAFLHSPLEGIPCHQLKRRYLPPINIQGWGREGGGVALFSAGRKKEGEGLKSGTHRLSSVPKEDPQKPV